MTEFHSRRSFISRSALALAGAGLGGVTPVSAQAKADRDDNAVFIGDRRELFVDSALIGRVTGEARHRLHHPRAQEIALHHDEPWESTQP